MRFGTVPTWDRFLNGLVGCGELVSVTAAVSSRPSGGVKLGTCSNARGPQRRFGNAPNLGRSMAGVGGGLDGFHGDHFIVG